jgi:hypothetical protein
MTVVRVHGWSFTMNRRQFIIGLLCAPALVRASSLDALPREIPLDAFGLHTDFVQWSGNQHQSGVNNWFRAAAVSEWYFEISPQPASPCGIMNPCQ